MVEGDFRGFERSEAVCFSDGQFDPVVQALHDSAVELLLGCEPVQDEMLVCPNAAGHLLDRFQPTAHRPLQPGVEEDARPVVRLVLPQRLEALLEQIRSHRLEAVAQHRKEKAEKASGQCVKTFVSDEWTLEYDLAFSGLAEHVYVAAHLAKNDEALDDATLRTETATAKSDFKKLQDEASKAVDEGNAEGCSHEEVRAAKVYSRFTKGKKASKTIAAQYLAERLVTDNKAGKLTAEGLRAKLPQYLVQAIGYVTRPLASDTAKDKQG